MHKLHKQEDQSYILKRVNYYNKLTREVPIQKGVKLRNFRLPRKLKTYFFDTYRYTRYFDSDLKIQYCFGDITYVPEEPSLVKSRPVCEDNNNSVILKLNKVRHYNFLQDPWSFSEKTNGLVWRGHISKLKPQRIRFLEKYFDHPRCNIGCTNLYAHYGKFIRPSLTIDEQLAYKFILCIEGNDVASNLKWVMSSNSLPLMPRPRYETWFMEGTLVPGVHYVEIKDDFSDLEEKLDYYSENQQEALSIIQNAHRYVNQFKNPKREKLISLLVLDKYFRNTGQY
ncbi:MAG: glycosyl transferase family 90 [Bacteroidota bacterium]